MLTNLARARLSRSPHRKRLPKKKGIAGEKLSDISLARECFWNELFRGAIMFKPKKKAKRQYSDYRAAWSSIVSEARTANNHLSKESEQLIARIDTLIDSIKEAKVA